MSKKFKSSWFYSKLGEYEVETGFIKKETKTKISQRYVDFESYSQRLQDKYEEFDSEGYDVINVIPISMGTSESSIASNGNYLGDAGFSITRGAVIIGKKRED